MKASNSTGTLGPTTHDKSNQEDLLLAGMRAGDNRAYETLVRNYSGRLFAVARRLLSCDEDAADAVQETFISAFRAIDGFHGQSALGTWLHRIAVNACLRKLSSRARHGTVSLEQHLPTFDETGRHVRPVVSWTEDAFAGLRRSEMRDRVRACIDQLPEDYRTILILRDIEELDTDETSELLGISLSAVKARLHRARQALRMLLESLAAGIGDGPVKRFGFAYGTLPDHAGSGEERFLIEWDREDDSVWYDILAFSRLRHFLARLGYPWVRRVQKKFGRESAAVMCQAVGAVI